MAPLKLPIWSCIHGRASSNTPPEVVRLLSRVKFNGKKNSSTFNHVFQFIQNVSNMIFKELMKAFYAEFLLSHLRQKLETGVELFQLPQFTVGINLLQFSFVNLMDTIMNRYAMKLNIYEDLKMSLLEILIFDFI